MRSNLLVITLLAATSVRANGSQDSTPQGFSLDKAVAYALAHSPILRGAQAEVRAARAEVGAARARALPQVSANAFASTGNMQGVLSTGMGVEPPALVLSPDVTFTDLNLTLMAPLYTGGRLGAQVAAASALQRAAQGDAVEMQADVALTVRESFMKALLGEELVRAVQARVEASEAMVRNAQAQFDAGKSILATVQRAHAELADARRELTTTVNDRAKSVLDLLAAMGAPLGQEVTLAGSLERTSTGAALEHYLRAATSRRGAVLSAGHRFKAAQERLAAARGAAGPQLYGYAMSDTFSPRDEMGRTSGYTVGLSLSLPVFDAGMRRNEISAAAAMADRQKAEFDQARLQAEKEVRQSWLDLQTAEANHRTAIAALEAAQSGYDVIALRVESGKSLLVEQLDALAALTRARANLAQSNFDYQLALARLERAAGLGPSGESSQ